MSRCFLCYRKSSLFQFRSTLSAAKFREQTKELTEVGSVQKLVPIACHMLFHIAHHWCFCAALARQSVTAQTNKVISDNLYETFDIMPSLD